MTSPSSCSDFFEYDINEATKAFTAAEFFVSVFHFLRAIEIGATYAKRFLDEYLSETSPVIGFLALCELICQFTIVLTLLIQSLVGFLLFPFAWKKRIMTVLICWSVVAVTNLHLIVALGVMHIVEPSYGLGNDIARIRIPFASLLYMFYFPYAMHVYYRFHFWAKEAGVAREISMSQITVVVTDIMDTIREKDPSVRDKNPSVQDKNSNAGKKDEKKRKNEA